MRVQLLFPGVSIGACGVTPTPPLDLAVSAWLAVVSGSRLSALCDLSQRRFVVTVAQSYA